MVVSNNRAYDGKLHICGMAVKSYADTVLLMVMAEKWVVPDAYKFLCWVLDNSMRLHKEASKLEK